MYAVHFAAGLEFTFEHDVRLFTQIGLSNVLQSSAQMGYLTSADNVPF